MAVLQQVHHWVQHGTPDMLQKQTAFYMVKRAHVFYPHKSTELYDKKESYKSFVTSMFNGTRWGDWICLSAICHMWNIPIGIVTPYKPSVIKMFHDKPKCDIILIANGWPVDKRHALLNMYNVVCFCNISNVTCCAQW